MQKVITIFMAWVCAIAFNAIMDDVHFRPSGGVWHISQNYFDAWHLAKLLMFACLAFAIVWAMDIEDKFKIYMFVTLAGTALLVHELLYHVLL